jgi:hypothetical protein
MNYNNKYIKYKYKYLYKKINLKLIGGATPAISYVGNEDFNLFDFFNRNYESKEHRIIIKPTNVLMCIENMNCNIINGINDFFGNKLLLFIPLIILIYILFIIIYIPIAVLMFISITKDENGVKIKIVIDKEINKDTNINPDIVYHSNYKFPGIYLHFYITEADIDKVRILYTHCSLIKTQYEGRPISISGMNNLVRGIPISHLDTHELVIIGQDLYLQGYKPYPEGSQLPNGMDNRISINTIRINANNDARILLNNYLTQYYTQLQQLLPPLPPLPPLPLPLQPELPQSSPSSPDILPPSSPSSPDILPPSSQEQFHDFLQYLPGIPSDYRHDTIIGNREIVLSREIVLTPDDVV